MAFSSSTSKPKPNGRRKPKAHPEYLPVFVKYEHFTKVRLEGHEYFQDGESTEESMSWVCGRTRKMMKCAAQLTIFRDGKFARRKAHNHPAMCESGVAETTSWQTYKNGLCQVFGRRFEKKKTGDKMYHDGHEFVCRSWLTGRCYWSCVEYNTERKCTARLSTWYDGVVSKVTNPLHNHKPPELTAGQRVQQEYDAWFPKQWAAPQPPPPPPKPVQQQPPPQQQQQHPQLKRPMAMKPLAPKPRPASPPQPPPPPPEVCLRWNSYHSNMQATFPALLNNEQFVDVTLACEGRSIKCHKMILSACSSYFDELLSQNPCQHPIVLMKDLKFWEVQALVEFMYRGEVNVGQDKLPFLLAAAEALQIKGLASPTSSTPQRDDDSMDPDYLDDIEVPSPSSARRSRKRRTIAATVPVRSTPPPAPAPVPRSARLQRTTNNSNNHHRIQQAQPSTSSYVPAMVHEPPTRRRRLDPTNFDVGDHVIREIKLEPVDIDASSDSMDHSTTELFQLTCEPATFQPTPTAEEEEEEEADDSKPNDLKADDLKPDDIAAHKPNEPATVDEQEEDRKATVEDRMPHEATEGMTEAIDTTEAIPETDTVRQDLPPDDKEDEVDETVHENGPHIDGNYPLSDNDAESSAKENADPVSKPEDAALTHEDKVDDPPPSDAVPMEEN